LKIEFQSEVPMRQNPSFAEWTPFEDLFIGAQILRPTDSTICERQAAWHGKTNPSSMPKISSVGHPFHPQLADS